MAQSQLEYVPKDAVSSGMKAGAAGATTGFLFSAVKTALSKRNIGGMSVFTRTGSLIVTMAVSAASYQFTRDASANLRRKDDHWNAALGGAMGGGVIGLVSRRIPSVVGAAFFIGSVLGGFEFVGSRLGGWKLEEDEYERKQRLRQNRRRPIEETLANIGEGRGIKPPGYEERRRQHLQEKYGVKINPIKIYEEE